MIDLISVCAMFSAIMLAFCYIELTYIRQVLERIEREGADNA